MIYITIDTCAGSGKPDMKTCSRIAKGILNLIKEGYEVETFSIVPDGETGYNSKWVLTVRKKEEFE